MRVHFHAYIEALGVLLVINIIEEVRLDLRRVNVTLDASDNLHRNVVIVFWVMAFEYGAKSSFAKLFYDSVLIWIHIQDKRLRREIIYNMCEFWGLTSVFDHISWDALIMTNFIINGLRIARAWRRVSGFPVVIPSSTVLSKRLSIGQLIVPIDILILSLPTIRCIIIWRKESSAGHAWATFWQSKYFENLDDFKPSLPMMQSFGGIMGTGALRCVVNRPAERLL